METEPWKSPEIMDFQGFPNAKIFLVRPDLMVKVKRTYETVIYPYRTNGPGNGHDAGGL